MFHSPCTPIMRSTAHVQQYMNIYAVLSLRVDKLLKIHVDQEHCALRSHGLHWLLIEYEDNSMCVGWTWIGYTRNG